MLDKNGICITWHLSIYISNKNARYVIIINNYIKGPPINTCKIDFMGGTLASPVDLKDLCGFPLNDQQTSSTSN